MADYNPPDSHWAADFDGRLVGTFAHLRDRIEELEEWVAALRAKDAERDAALAQAVADVKFYTRGRA